MLQLNNQHSTIHLETDCMLQLYASLIYAQFIVKCVKSPSMHLKVIKHI